jgi:OOP family OmpA-OmpF porin
MKTRNILLTFALGAAMLVPSVASAQDAVASTSVDLNPVCHNHYYSNWKDNWFIQLGAGMNAPFFENYLANGDEKHHITLDANLAVGRWFSPYLAWRLSAQGGAIHWDNNVYSKAKYANLNFDFMWDMFNSIAGVKSNRIFSIVPFVGLGGAYTWDVKGTPNIYGKKGNPSDIKDASWTLPVSAGLQLRFNLCKYADFFVEGRALFAGDNFNGTAYGDPVDVNISAVGGFTFYLGGKNFKSYNPCDYIAYINGLNSQINDLRGELNNCNSKLAAAEAQLPCPEVKEAPAAAAAAAPMLSTVRFNINSAKVTNDQMINVYNVANWMKQNPNAKVAIKGYADKKTGTAKYNKALSEKRAKAVYDALVNNGIDGSRLSTSSFGDSEQPYSDNAWNRVVIFAED